MKKLITVIALCISTGAANSQNYGETNFLHTNSQCSTGIPLTLYSSGFLMAGYQPAPAAGQPNFYVDKFSSGGSFNAGDFSNEYIVNCSNGCSANLQATSTGSVTVIETKIPGTPVAFFALAGLTEGGCFFATLSSSGAPISKKFYPFPGGNTLSQVPLIVESTVNANEYFIAGRYWTGTNWVMFILRVDAVGVPIDSKIYSFQGDLYPAAMIMSPYTNEIVVVGATHSSTSNEAFFMRIDPANLANITQCDIYQKNQPGGTNYFSSIAVANSPTGGKGFVIGGYTDLYLPNGGDVWMLKVDPTGTPIWNTVILSTQDANAKLVFGVIERNSTNNYGFTYYGVVGSVQGMMVLKLDDNGLLFTVALPIDDWNEFVYIQPFNPGSQNYPTSISYLDQGGADVGIQVYGNRDLVLGGTHYFVEAAFNGVDGCNSIYTGATQQNGPKNINPQSLNVSTGLQPCNAISITVSAVNTTPSNPCPISAGLPFGASNNRSTLVTGLAKLQNSSNAFDVYPNPVSSKLQLRYYATSNGQAMINLYDYLGRQVTNIPASNAQSGSQVTEVDFEKLNIESGVYLISATIDGLTTKQKVVYNKN